MAALANTNDERHELDIHEMEWRIEAHGFKKTNIRFEYNRERLLSILSSEIYENPYVFLRELLQNSIDAITMRKEILERKGVGGDKTGIIRVIVSRHDDGIDIEWIDDGIGMDEYIVANYFSAIGRSYYRSPDFEKEDLSFHPISKFGIGILSCFTVADEMIVNTYREPYANSPCKEGLRIKISNPMYGFRIEAREAGECMVGTSIALRIADKKLAGIYEKIGNDTFNVTAYLCAISEYVKYPIFVDEYGKKTVISRLSLEQLRDRTQAIVIEDYAPYSFLHDLERKIFEKTFLPQDQHLAKEVFQLRIIDLADDLKIEGMEGKLGYWILDDDVVDLSNNYDHTFHGLEISSMNFILASKDESADIRWKKDVNRYDDGQSAIIEYINKESEVAFQKVFNAGIWVGGLYIHRYNGNTYNYHIQVIRMPDALIYINICDDIKDSMHIARSGLTSKNIESHMDSIWDKALAFLASELIHSLEHCHRKDSLYMIARFILNYRLGKDKVLDSLSDDLIYVPFVHDNGKISYDLLSDETVMLIPEYFYEFIRPRFSTFLDENDLPGVELPCGHFLLLPSTYNEYSRSISTFEGVVYDLLLYLLNGKHCMTSIKVFPIEGDATDSAYTYSEIWNSDATNPIDVGDADINSFREHIYSNTYTPSKINNMVIDYLLSAIFTYGGHKYYGSYAKFADFIDCDCSVLFYGSEYINCLNPASMKLLKMIMDIYEIIEKKLLNSADLGILIDELTEITFFNSRASALRSLDSIDSINLHFAKIHGLIAASGLDTPDDAVKISMDDFVPGSFPPYLHKNNNTPKK